MNEGMRDYWIVYHGIHVELNIIIPIKSWSKSDAIVTGAMIFPFMDDEFYVCQPHEYVDHTGDLTQTLGDDPHQERKAP